MTSIVKLEALSGVRDDGPLCYLLQVDDTYLLLDCGWDENFDLLYIDAVKRRIPQINAVLLSFADPAHLGALPYLVAKAGLSVPVYATVPVYKMGQMFMYDWLNSHLAVEEFDLFSLDDVDAAFEKVQQVKYNQTVLLKGDSGLQITPMPAGRMIGGAIWRISKMCDDEIVYAVDYNHKKERHLNGCLFDAIQRPHLLITDAYNAVYKQPGRKQRDEKLVTQMLDTLRAGGDCLVVIDTAGRVLEIAHMLDQFWSNADLQSFNLVMLSHVASSVVEFAKSQVEWMSDKILKSFETGRFNPFQFRHVQLCHSLPELVRVRSPKVVLCADLSMECGFSRELFLEWCSDTRNTIIITGRSRDICRSGDRTLGSKLIRMAEADKSSARQLKLEIKRRIKLEGTELDEYRARKKADEQEEARKKMESQRRVSRLGGKADESDSDSDDDDALASAVAAVTGMQLKSSSVAGGPPGAIVSTPRPSTIGGIPSTPLIEGKPTFTQQEIHASSAHDILLKWEQAQRSSFFKQNKKSFPMFGYVEEKVKWDDYGEIIRPEDYMIDSVVPQAEAERKPKAEEFGHEAMQGPSIQPVTMPEEKEWPTKCIKYITRLEVLCRVEFIEFEGRSDGESVKKILSQIRPKQLLLVHGSTENTLQLEKYAKENGIAQGRIFTPVLGEVVDATVESHIFQVALSDELLSSFVFQHVKDAELVWLDALLIRKAREDAKEDEGGEEEQEQESMETDSDGAPAAKRLRSRRAADKFVLGALAAQSVPPHHAVFVNEPKLSDVKAVLVAEGFQAEFSTGVLYINGVASIRRNEAGRFHVEGCAGEEYFKIRDIIYNQFAIV